MSNFFTSSIGKKVVMSLAGLFLMSFLVVHLSINLMLMRNDGGEWFKAGVHFMTTNPLIKIMEFVLFGGFLVHILWAAILTLQNMLARKTGYAKTHASQTSFFSKYMVHTGVIVFLFLCLHFVNFYFVKLGLTKAPEGAMAVENSHDFYAMAINLFTNKIYSVIYMVFMILLSFHLHHAFQSAFQTLGLNHLKYTPIIKFVGWAYSILVPLGFAAIPVYFMFFYN
jgi:succinate dehydrogenase / fumarate reductase, cytochrome b subunit